MNDFDPEQAIKTLEENRKEYIGKLLKYVNECIAHDNYDMATNYIVAASSNLLSLEGSIGYLEAIKACKDEYPEFKTLFD